MGFNTELNEPPVIPRDVEANFPAGQFLSQSALPTRSSSVICERETLGSKKTQETREIIQRSSLMKNQLILLTGSVKALVRILFRKYSAKIMCLLRYFGTDVN